MYRLAITRKILTNFKKRTFSKIYIFCFNDYAIIIAKILRENGYCVEGILDNNRIIFGKKILGLQIYSPYFLRTKTIKYKSSILVLITNQFKNNISIKLKVTYGISFIDFLVVEPYPKLAL